MIVSMTGYGSAFSSNDFLSATVVIKAVNSKYFDIKVKLPRFLYQKEIDYINILKSKLLRGKIEVFVDITLKKPLRKASLNKEYFTIYMDILRQIQIESEILDDIKIEHLLSFENLIEYLDDPDINHSIEDDAEHLIVEAVKNIQEMRRIEGSNLEIAIKESLDVLKEHIVKIETFKSTVFQMNLEKYKKRISELTENANEDRIITEAGILSERADITEETERVKSHLNQFRNIMEKEFPCGKKLDFLCQELNREFNTIGSKSGLVDIINLVVSGKSEIDKIREQVQNII